LLVTGEQLDSRPILAHACMHPRALLLGRRSSTR
jgi:hypothetical protein